MAAKKYLHLILICSLLLTGCDSKDIEEDLSNTYIVNSLADGPDQNINDNLCETKEGVCTLRAAIMQANAKPEKQTILLPSPRAGNENARSPIYDTPAKPRFIYINQDDLGDDSPTPHTSTYKLDIQGDDPAATQNADQKKTAASKGDLDIFGDVEIIAVADGWSTPYGPLEFNSLGEYISQISEQYWIYIDGSALGDRIFDIHEGTVNITGVRIIGGRVSGKNGNGGAIRHQGKVLTLESVTLLNNVGAPQGGALHVSKSSIAKLHSVTIANNIAGTIGGGIYSEGILEIKASALIGNTSNYGPGGAIYAHSGALGIESTTISNNKAIGLKDERACQGAGGGIYIFDAEFSITKSIIAYNQTNGFGGGIANLSKKPSEIISSSINNNRILNTECNGEKGGGGLYNNNPEATAQVIISHSTISGNQTVQGPGGGIYNGPNGLAYLTNLTVSGNLAANGGGIANENYMNISNLTITLNRAQGSGGGYLSLNVEQERTIIQNTILANNQSAIGGADCQGAIVSLGYNLIGDGNQCQYQPTGHELSGAPKLAPLAYNGNARLLTHAPRHGSPAINAGNPTGCQDSKLEGNITIDQRGFDRHQGAACDIGAYETIEVCVSFDTATNSNGQIFETAQGENIAILTMLPLELTNGAIYYDGVFGINADYNKALKLELKGPALNLNLRNVQIDFLSPVLGLTLDFWRISGDINLIINQEKAILEKFGNIPMLGETKVTVFSNIVTVDDKEQEFGSITVDGKGNVTIDSFLIGGENIYIDNICAIVP